MTDTREDTPRQPTSEECTANAPMPIPGRPDTVARAAWWPQMGGYVAHSVVTVGDVFEVWVWHNGMFPFNDDPGLYPAHLSLSSADQWIDYFARQKSWFADMVRADPDLYAMYGEVFDTPERSDGC